MNKQNTYKRHRFPPEFIQYAKWLYHRFNLSHRAIEDLLAERGVTVSYESIRLWYNKFGPRYAQVQINASRPTRVKQACFAKRELCAPCNDKNL